MKQKLCKDFVLETYIRGPGAVLSKKQPIAFTSTAPSPLEKNYAVTELETLAVVWSCTLTIQQWRPFLRRWAPVENMYAGGAKSMARSEVSLDHFSGMGVWCVWESEECNVCGKWHVNV